MQSYKRKTFLCIIISLIVAVNGLSRVMNDYQTFVGCSVKLKYAVEETQKFVFISKYEESTTDEKLGRGEGPERFQKHSIRIGLIL